MCSEDIKISSLALVRVSRRQESSDIWIRCTTSRCLLAARRYYPLVIRKYADQSYKSRRKLLASLMRLLERLSLLWLNRTRRPRSISKISFICSRSENLTRFRSLGRILASCVPSSDPSGRSTKSRPGSTQDMTPLRHLKFEKLKETNHYSFVLFEDELGEAYHVLLSCLYPR